MTNNHDHLSAGNAGCGTPGCTDPNCDYGKGPLRCQSCGAVVVGEPQAARESAVIAAIDPFTRGAFTGWMHKSGDDTITLDEAEDHFSLCMADMMDAARAAASQPSPAATVERREDETGEEYELRVGRVGRPQCSAGSSVVNALRTIYASHPICQQAADEIERLSVSPQSAQASAWRVCWVSLNTSRTELFEDEGKAAAKAREVGGCVIPLGTLSLSRPK